MTKVKICGITNLEDARHAIECGADMLGFNFYRGSKRHVEPAIAADIVRELSGSTVEYVGVFVNAEAAEIAEIVRQVGMDIVQLHGDEPEMFIDDLRNSTPAEIIKVFRVRDADDFQDATGSKSTYVMLDSYSEKMFGGSGRTFNWDIAQEISILLPEAIFLAGGLTPDNVADAIRTVRPYAVDVASGVESSPGKKDPEKVAAFIRAAKEAL